MRNPGRDRLNARGVQAANDLVGGEWGGKIEVVGRHAKQRIAHRTANEARPAALRIERFEQRHYAWAIEPKVRIDPHRTRRDRLTSIAAVAPQMR